MIRKKFSLFEQDDFDDSKDGGNNQCSLQGIDVEDMIAMDRLSEATILENLSERYKKDKIYTYIGSVLVALNPLRLLPIYDVGTASRYPAEPLGSMQPRPPPHIFAVAGAALGSVLQHAVPQVVLMNGESGAGKTETGKLVLRHLVHLGGGSGALVERRVVEADPILEAFGNARTLRNANSSRFGKFVDLAVGRVGGGILGGRVEHFLLERSRVVQQEEGERNFHVFYHLLAGLDQGGRTSRYLTNCPADYRYMQQWPELGVEDREGFQQLYSSLALLAFSPEEIGSLWSLLAAILHLGNIEFRGNDEDESACEPTALSFAHVEAAARLLGVSETTLVSALTTKTRATHSEVIVSPVSSGAASSARDALSRAVYGRLFDRLVAKINAAIRRTGTGGDNEDNPNDVIGILDVFGFENLNHNSFEQLCINFANEVLHQFFLTHLFKEEQAEYAREGINWKEIDFKDNQDVLELLAGPSPGSVLGLLDDLARLGNGSDQALIRQLHAARKSDPSYARPPADADQRFGVVHFAGRVIYKADGMVAKNRDELHSALVELLTGSSSALVRGLFSGESERRRRQTLLHQFRGSMDALMTRLRAREAHFVRCVKPNEEMIPGHLDRDLCARQLRYLGVRDTVRIRQAGYAIRYRIDEFCSRYRGLLPKRGSYSSDRELVEALCGLLTPGSWAIGLTKVFLRLPAEAELQKRRAALVLPGVVRLQALWRGHVTRRHFAALCVAAIALQRWWRNVLYRRDLRQGWEQEQLTAGKKMLNKKPQPKVDLLHRRGKEPPKPTQLSVAHHPVRYSFFVSDPYRGSCLWVLRLPRSLPPPPARPPLSLQSTKVEFRVARPRSHFLGAQ